MFRVRDFIEIPDGLVFSVISNLHPPRGVLSQLRFVRGRGGLRKVPTSEEAHRFLQDNKPCYLQYCRELDAEVTVVPFSEISRHYQPGPVLSEIMRGGNDPDILAIVTALMSRSGIGLEDIGITGSYLLGAQSTSSDIDLVFYGLENYQQVKRAFLECLEEDIFSQPSNEDWKEIYIKRKLDPNTYTLQEFVWHETRKHNRGKFGKRRFDILFARKKQEIEGAFGDCSFKRLGMVDARCTVFDAGLSFDYPARYKVRDCCLGDREVSEVVSFTHTFVEQARAGESVLCRGILESVSGPRDHFRILVGTSREAPGEFIKVFSKKGQGQ